MLVISATLPFGEEKARIVAGQRRQAEPGDLGPSQRLRLCLSGPKDAGAMASMAIRNMRGSSSTAILLNSAGDQ